MFADPICLYTVKIKGMPNVHLPMHMFVTVNTMGEIVTFLFFV
jgi:hypothetical protein